MDNQKDSGKKIYSLFVPLIILSLLIDIFALPESIEIWKPNFTLLFLIFFASFDPSKVNIEIAFVFGLILDLLLASPLGSYAFIFCTQIYIIVSQFKRFYSYAIYQQLFLVGIISFISFAITYWLLHLIGVPTYEVAFLQKSLSMAILWPIIFYLSSFLCRIFNITSSYIKENK